MHCRQWERQCSISFFIFAHSKRLVKIRWVTSRPRWPARPWCAKAYTSTFVFLALSGIQIFLPGVNHSLGLSRLNCSEEGRSAANCSCTSTNCFRSTISALRGNNPSPPRSKSGGDTSSDVAGPFRRRARFNNGTGPPRGTCPSSLIWVANRLPQREPRCANRLSSPLIAMMNYIS